MRLPVKEQTLRFLRRFFHNPGGHRPITARTLAKLILTAIRLLPVALSAQFCGFVSIVTSYRSTGAFNVFLGVWFALGILYILLSLRFAHHYWRDAERTARVRLWVRRWTLLAVFSGVLWGVAGPTLLVAAPGVRLSIVAVIVGVTFASWPVFSCWLPSLIVFTALSLAPLTAAIAVQYGLSRVYIAMIVLVLTVFIFYAGRRLNELIVSAVVTDEQNQRLVARLRAEVHRSELERRKTQLESERRSRFFAAANHDIRQPLQAMGIYLDILRRRVPPAAQPIVEQLSATSGSISTLVEQILMVTRMEFGQVQIHPEHVFVPDLLGELASQSRPIALKKGLRLRVSAVPASIFTDRALVSRALKNLISNAIAYSDPKARVPEIVLGARRVGSRLVIGVYDCGPGIAPEDRERIFSTFYRGESGRGQPGSGYGLGLSIVRGIARQLGIKVTLGSVLGRGSVFRLTFSIDESEQADRLREPDAQSAAIVPISGTVLLIEDNRVVREAIEGLLKGWGAGVIAAAAPDAAFFEAAARAGNLAAAVSDYNLGEGEPTGLEVLGDLEARLGRALPAVLLTAVAADLIEHTYGRARAERRAMPSVMPCILQKPAEAGALNAALARAVASQKNGREAGNGNA